MPEAIQEMKEWLGMFHVYGLPALFLLLLAILAVRGWYARTRSEE